MRKRFFKVVLEDVVIRQWWIAHLDLFLDDDKFSADYGWGSGSKRKLTNAIKKRLGDGCKVIQLKDGYTQRYHGQRQNITEFANFTSDGSICVSLLRHIRNAVAHRRAELMIHKRTRYFHFCDYNLQGAMTAEILISQETLEYIFEKYEAFADRRELPAARAA